MLKRTVVEVCKRGDSPKPPQDRGGVYDSQTVVAAPDRTMCSQTLRVMDDWGEPVSKRATQPNWADERPLLWILILVVNVEWSIEIIPRTSHGPCSARGWAFCAMFPVAVVTERMSPPWSGGTFGENSEKPEELVVVSQVGRRCCEDGSTSKM